MFQRAWIPKLTITVGDQAFLRLPIYAVAIRKEELDMPTPQKEMVISELCDIIKQSSGAILTDYRGLTVAEISVLRKRLRAIDSEYHVVKNTLYRRAIGQDATEKLGVYLTGPTAILFIRSDMVASAKTLSDFLRETRKPDVKIKGAWIDGKIFSADQVIEISKLPPREQIVAQLISSLNAPASNLIGTLNNILGEFVRTVQAIADQKSEALQAS